MAAVLRNRDLLVPFLLVVPVIVLDCSSLEDDCGM